MANFKNIIQEGGSGDVVGPDSSTDNAVARYDGTTGKLLQNSGVTIDDSGNLTANNISGTNTGDQALQSVFDNGQSITIADTDNQTLSVTQNDTTNNPNAVNIVNAGTGNGMFIDQNGNGIALRIDSEATTVKGVDINGEQTGTDVFYIQGNGALVSATAATMRVLSNNASQTAPAGIFRQEGTGDGLKIDKNNSGNGIIIDQNANDANPCYGIELNVDNAGAGTEYAFRFTGPESETGTYTNNVVAANPNGFITARIGTTDIYIPVYTTKPA